MLWQLLLFAQDTAQGAAQGTTQPGGSAPSGGGDPMLFLMLPAILILGYFLLVRPARRQEQERNKLITNLKKNDEVLTVAGIIGTVVSVSETEDEVVVRLDDHTRVRMVKSSIMKNLTAEKALKEPKEPKKEEK
jgi:preprotein translocase subunit YajC